MVRLFVYMHAYTISLQKRFFKCLKRILIQQQKMQRIGYVWLKVARKMNASLMHPLSHIVSINVC